LLGKIGKGSASAIRDILVDVASEAVKKILLPEKLAIRRPHSG
jgi:hypothetical protein